MTNSSKVTVTTSSLTLSSSSSYGHHDDNGNGCEHNRYLKSIVQLNNNGVSCMRNAQLSSLPPPLPSGCLTAAEDSYRNTSEMLSKAGNYFQRSLNKGNELCFFPEQSNGFSWSRYNRRGEKGNIRHGEYDEGMAAFCDPIALNGNSSHLSMHTIMATIMFNFGVLYLRLNEDDESSNCFSRSLELARKAMGGTIPGKVKINNNNAAGGAAGFNLIAILHNIGYLQYRSGHYEEAITTYNTALQMLKNSQQQKIDATGTKSIHVNSHSMLATAATLNCLGVLYCHLLKPDPDKALELCTDSLSIRRAVIGSDTETVEVGTLLNNIGRVYFMKGENENALEMYSQALGMRRRLLGDEHIDVAATVYNAGQTYHQCGDLSDAMELYEIFLLIAKKNLFGSAGNGNGNLQSHHCGVAITLRCMAQIYHEKKNFDKASNLYRQALEVGRSAFGTPHHPEVASVLNKWGNLLYEVGDFDGALKRYEEGLEVERAVYDGLHPNIVVTLTNIGQIYKLRENYTEALRLHQEAVTIQRQSLGHSHPSISNNLSYIAMIHYRTRDYAQAFDAYQEVLSIRRVAYGDDHLEVASTLNSIGLVLFKMELHECALRSFDESLRIRQKLLGPNHRDVAVILFNIATLYAEIGDDIQAMNHYLETLRVEKMALGPRHHDVVLTMLHIGQVHQQQGEFTKALQYYTQVLDIRSSSNNKNNTCYTEHDYDAIAHIWNHIGNIHLQRGSTKNMMLAFSNAVRYFRMAGKDENDLVISRFNLYGISKLHPECAPVA